MLEPTLIKCSLNDTSRVHQSHHKFCHTQSPPTNYHHLPSCVPFLLHLLLLYSFYSEIPNHQKNKNKKILCGNFFRFLIEGSRSGRIFNRIRRSSVSGEAMAISGHHKPSSDATVFRFCPFWQSRKPSSSPSPSTSKSSSFKTVSSAARSLLPSRRRLRLDPANYLYFPYVPGKQVRTAVRLKNTSKSRVAFKFQTTAPKSCYMRPPGGILAPGESLIAIVFKFVEQPENNEKLSDEKNKVKFKIISLKVKDGVDYVPELFDEQKDQVTVERILRAVFVDPERPNHALEKMKRQLAEADAALEARESRKKPQAETGPRIGEGLVIDEWKVRRERYLARQQVEAAVESA